MRFFKVSLTICPAVFLTGGDAEPSYETTPNWHSRAGHRGRPYAKMAQFLFWIRLAVFLTRGSARMKLPGLLQKCSFFF
jgi:hypothetical protein